MIIIKKYIMVINFCYLLIFLILFPAHASAGKEKGLTRAFEVEREEFIEEEKVALIVGLSAYPSYGNVSALDYADDDAIAMGKQLESFGYRVRVLTNYEATSGALINVLDDLGNYLTKDKGTFLFYFSGHGFAKDKINYLATYETDPENIQSSGLALNTVIERMQASGAKRQVLLVDACRNDPENGRKSVMGKSRGFVDFGFAEGTQILFSTKFGGASYEYNRLNHGVYTHYLLKGLQGEARQNDGIISFTDLALYVSKAVKDFGFKTNRTQIPFVSGESYGDILLHANERVEAPLITKIGSPTSHNQQVKLDVSITQSVIMPQNIPIPKPQKKQLWYKNPWVWAGFITGGGAAMYISQSKDSGGDRTVVGR